jgi:hypothetical protein
MNILPNLNKPGNWLNRQRQQIAEILFSGVIQSEMNNFAF